MEQWRFAEKVGCSKETIRKIEKGKIPLTDLLATKIAIATGVAKHWLLANDLNSSPVDEWLRPYTLETFHLSQSEQDYMSQVVTADNHSNEAVLLWAWTRTIMAGAQNKGAQSYRLFSYKFRSMLIEFQREFGFDPAVFDISIPSGALQCVANDVAEVTALAVRRQAKNAAALKRQAEIQARIDSGELVRSSSHPHAVYVEARPAP